LYKEVGAGGVKPPHPPSLSADISFKDDVTFILLIGVPFEKVLPPEAESKEKHSVWDPMPELI
jgi:hypothetical protein